jgi:carbonic anhydrase/acetyltransferase-like protein (isoleucine patch superfamily)
MRHKYKLLSGVTHQIKLPSREEDSFAARDTYPVLHQIKALIDIPRYGVKAGDIGGYVENKHVLSHDGDCWVGDNAIAWGKTYVEGNAFVGEDAILWGANHAVQLIVRGNARIDGSPVIETIEGFTRPDYFDSVIDEDVHIFENVYIRNPIRIFGSAQIYGSAQINDVNYIYGDAKIYEAAFLQGSNSISGNVEIFGNTIIDKNTIISGNSRIGTSGKLLYVHANRKLTDVIMESPLNEELGEPHVKTKAPPGSLLYNFAKLKSFKDKKKYENKLLNFIGDESLSTSSNEQVISIQTLEDIASRIDGYQHDIVKIIKYPLMVDTTDPFTSKMMMLFNKAQRLRNFSDNKQFGETVDALEEAFLAAESNALRLSTSKLSEDEQRRTTKAKDLLSIAMDDAASENEKQVAFKQGLKQLEGIILIPEHAVETFRVKAGIAQLTA